jgi:hypothetical protein
VLAPEGTATTICVSLQEVTDACTPLRLTLLAVDPLPCEAPKPEPLMVNAERGAPALGVKPDMTGSGSEEPVVMETLSNVAVAGQLLLPLEKPKPTYKSCAVLMVCVVPICVHVAPSEEA